MVLGFLIATKVQYFIATAFPIFAYLLILAVRSELKGWNLFRRILLFAAPIVILAAFVYTPITRRCLAGPSPARWVPNLSGRPMVGSTGGRLCPWAIAEILRYPCRTRRGFGLLLGIHFLANDPGALWQRLSDFVRLRIYQRYIGPGRHSHDAASDQGVREACRACASPGFRVNVLRLATGNLVLTTYFVFIAAMLAFSVFTNGEVVKQGRYWLPFILANFLCATIYASEVLPGGCDQRFRAQCSLLYVYIRQLERVLQYTRWKRVSISQFWLDFHSNVRFTSILLAQIQEMRCNVRPHSPSREVSF